MAANDKQIGGSHYKKGGEEHWDRQWRLFGRGYFIGCITKYVERYHEKNGVQDLHKAIHFLEKLIELESASVLQPYKPDRPEYENQITPDVLIPGTPTHSQFFRWEGGWGDNTNHYRCTRCKQYVRALTPEQAEAMHDCPNKDVAR